MSAESVAVELRDRSEAFANARRTAVPVLFGDRWGLVVFLGAVCLFGLVWRTTFLINDSVTLANGLYSLSNGQVALLEPAYGGTLNTPGVNSYGGREFARNYGVIALSLPYLLVLQGLAAVVELRIALVGLWSLALLALLVQCGRLADSDRVIVGGGIAVLGLFGLNVALARPLDPSAVHLYALQLFHLTVAAFVPVFCYRLLTLVETRRLGLLGAVAVTAGTPLAFWASVPKRHVVTAAVVMGVAYCLYRSRREADGPVVSRSRTFRALAYGLVGLYAWVHAPEALLLCVTLALVDVPTAPENSPRTLAVVGGVFLLSLIPFALTNVAITGSPVKPPRLLAGGYSAGGDAAAGGGSAGDTGGSSNGSGGILAPLQPLFGVVESGARPLLLLVDQLLVGFRAFRAEPIDVYHTFVRSGSAQSTLSDTDAESVNLSLLESVPLLAALAGVLPVVARRRSSLSLPDRRLGPARVVDLFAATTVLGLVLLYTSRLPTHAQVTARYLFPLCPLGVYLAVRLPPVRDALANHWRAYLWTASATVLVGGQFALVAVALTVNGIGEAFQFHALVGLGTALPLGLWSLRGRSEGKAGRLGAVLLGLATGVTLVFVLLTVLEYYALGDSHALPMMRALGELVGLY
ncbi:hypothetical protein ACOZ4I_05120 [Haloarcula salina]|uniref:hypothetical protein n=1 Tax=Haloarcula salina TaxID=1429914 RepID=UPI003C6F3AB2